jgi:ribosomal protein S18 acetylase RimI-like enzyme
LLSITPYSAHHYQALIALFVDFKQESAAVSDVFDELKDNFTPAIALYVDQHIARSVSTNVSTNVSGILLAMDDDTPVGFIVAEQIAYFPFCKIERIGHIKELFVAKSHRGRGLAKRLITELEAAFYADGISEFKIETIVHYENNVGFYQSMGYETFLLDMRKSVR